MISDTDLIVYILTSVVLMMMFAFAVIWFLNHTQKKITVSKLAEQERELTFQNELLKNTVKTQEQERERISKELHDDVASKLNIIHLNMHLLKMKVEADDETMQLIDQIETALSNSSERTRKISHEMMPVILKKFGIHYALKELKDSVNVSQALSIEIENDELIKISDDFKTLHIYRIIQEALNNTLKYADATKVHIFFEEQQDKIKMDYKDNGKGFDVSQNNEGLGLSNINTRIRLLNGSMKLHSSLGNGVNMIFEFPNYG